MSIRGFLVSLAIGLALLLLNSKDIGTTERIMPQQRRITGSEAILRALQYTGFDKYTSLSVEKNNVSVDLIDLDAADYYLFPDSCASLVWRITFRSVGLPRLALKDNPREKGERNYDVLIEPYSGKLLRIHSIRDDNNRDPADSIGSLEKRLKTSDALRFTGMPDSLPGKQFVDILKAAISNPNIPNEIIAYYVYQSRGGEKIRAIWSIDLRGIPPDYAPGLRSSERFPRSPISHFRRVWDATTGELLYGVNAP